MSDGLFLKLLGCEVIYVYFDDIFLLINRQLSVRRLRHIEIVEHLVDGQHSYTIDVLWEVRQQLLLIDVSIDVADQ